MLSLPRLVALLLLLLQVLPKLLETNIYQPLASQKRGMSKGQSFLSIGLVARCSVAEETSGATSDLSDGTGNQHRRIQEGPND